MRLIYTILFIVLAVTGCGNEIKEKIVDNSGKTLLECVTFPTSNSNTVIRKPKDSAFKPSQNIIEFNDECSVWCSAMAISEDGDTLALFLSPNDSMCSCEIGIFNVDWNSKTSQGMIKKVKSYPYPNIFLSTVDYMDISHGKIACQYVQQNVIQIIDIETLSSIKGFHFRNDIEPIDVKFSPDGQYIALYGNYLVRKYPESIDIFYPYSRKPIKYLAVWKVSDGTLVGDFEQKDFIRSASWKKLTNDHMRAFRIKRRFGEIVWIPSEKGYDISLPEGYMAQIDVPENY